MPFAVVAGDRLYSAGKDRRESRTVTISEDQDYIGAAYRSNNVMMTAQVEVSVNSV